MIVTADHGAAPPAASTGAWPIAQSELIADVNRHFGVDDVKDGLVASSGAFGLFLDRDLAAELDVTAAEISNILSGYTIRDNWRGESLPEGYEGRGDEQVLAAAFPSRSIHDIVDCAGRP